MEPTEWMTTPSLAAGHGSGPSCLYDLRNNPLIQNIAYCEPFMIIYLCSGLLNLKYEGVSSLPHNICVN
jgi:hypothetical protein